MRIIFFYLILLGSLLYGSGSFANTSTAPAVTHPKICVVLSGGGSRGFAHIGVLKYLEEHYIPINCIAGTSMGAIIGGLYATGMSAVDIEKKLNGMRLDDIALDIVDRRQLAQPLREDDTNYPINATFGLTKNGISLPLGAVGANQFLEILQNWTSQLPPNISFDQLTIPFRTVATDLESGEMVLFDKGSIATAMRASMAAPGVFPPIEINGRLLADGGLVRNLPVDIARKMGADRIIAVNIGTPLLPREELTSFVDISHQMLNILTEQNVDQQKKLLQSEDILIDPHLGTIGFMDFDRAKEAVEIGYQAATALGDKLAALSLNEASYVAELRARPSPQLPSTQIAFVDVQSSGRIPADDIRRQLHIPIGSAYDATDINQRISPLINSRQYDSIVHSLVQRDGEYGVKIDATERRWGPNFIRLGLDLSTGFDGQSGFEFQLGHRLPWVNESGLEWRNDLQFGNTFGIRSELRQPLSKREGEYVAPFIDEQLKTLSFYNNNKTIAEYTIQSSQLGLDFGFPLGDHGRLGEIRSGIGATHYELRPRLGGIITELSNGEQVITSFNSLKMDEVALHSHFIVDQLDAAYFPSEGYAFGGELIAGVNRDSTTPFSSDTHSQFKSFEQISFHTMLANSFGDNSINLSMKVGARNQTGSAIPGIGLSLGGFQQLSAYQPDQFFGNYLLYGNATYLYRALKFGLAGQAAFLGTSLELGNAGNSRTDFSLANIRKSLSLFVGAKTWIGPIHFGIAIAPAGTFNLFLQLGRQ